MPSIEESYQIIIDAIKEAKQKIDSVRDPQLDSLKARILNPMIQNINSMSMQIGNRVVGELEEVRTKPGAPLLRMFGRAINPQKEKRVAMADLATVKQTEKQIREAQRIKASDSDVEVLRTERDNFMQDLFNVEPEILLEKYSDLAIRAGAKLAKLPFTETIPDKLNTGSIDMIKKAVETQRALNAKAEEEDEKPKK